MEKTDPILFIPPVHWNYYPYRDQELPASMAQRGYSCIYLNPVSYRGSEKSMRFRQLNKRELHQNIRLVDRTSPWGKSLCEFFRENILNVQAVKRFKPRAVISSDHLMSAGVCIYCRMKGIRFIFDVTDNWELVDRSMAGKIYKFFLKPLLARFSFAITSTSKRQIVYFQKRRNNHSYLIPNGINPRMLALLDREKPQGRAKSEVNFIGSLRDWYDFDMLFDIFKEFPTINLNIYGLGPMYDELLEKASSIPNVHVLGNVDSSLGAELLHRTLFGILPLKINELNQSTCPIKLFDYWGASRAVISSPVEEVSRLGGDSLLYASTREEFVEKIRTLISEAELAQNMGMEGRKKVDEIHNYGAITDRFLQIMNTIT